MNLLKSVFALLAGTLVLVLAFMFSVVFLAIFAALGAAVWVFFWWKTRKLRQAMRERPAQSAAGHVIDGEAVVVEEHAAGARPVLPGDPPAR
jgi:uncharacterized membrane protein